MDHHYQLENCSNGECKLSARSDHPNRKVQQKKQRASMQFVFEDVNKNDDAFINNFKQRLEKTSYVKFADEDVNKKADDFIKNFRKQLKFEREESLKRYRENIDRQKG